MKIGREIKRLRSEARLTQEQLAADLKIGVSTLRLYENGSRTPPAEVIAELSRRFSVPSDVILGISSPAVGTTITVSFKTNEVPPEIKNEKTMNARIDIRVKEQMKRDFDEAAESVGLKESAALRMLMVAFIKKYKPKGGQENAQ
jgi:transcriptional regulator with XRE-family HTH domain